MTNLPPIIVGRHSATSKRALRSSVVLAVAVGLFWTVQGIVGVSADALGPFDVIRHGLLLLALLAAVHAYRNDGLAICWALVGLPVAASVLTGPGVGITSGGLGPLRRLGFAVAGGLVGAATLGTAGFVVGSVLARLRAGLGGIRQESRG